MVRIKQSFFLCTIMLMAAQAMAYDYNTWLQPIYYTDQQYANDSLDGYITDVGGVILGVDKKTDDYNTLGSGFSYFNAKQKDINNMPSNININNYAVFLYGTHSFNTSSDFAWLASAGVNNYKSTIYITNTLSTTGSYMGQQALVRGIVNKIYSKGNFRVVPQLSAHVLYLHQNAYTNHPAYSEEVRASNAGVFMLGAGIKTTTVYKKSLWQMQPEVRCILFYDIFAADINALSALLIGGPAIGTSATPGRASGQFGVGFNAQVSSAFKCSINYDLLLKSSYFNNILSLQLKYSF